MPRSRQENQRIKEERRRQIMDAALKVFAQKGLAGAMISDIAAAADLSYGLIYHYFHDKEELFIALVERALQGALRLTEEVAARPGTPWERLQALVREMVEGARDAPEYFRIIVQAQLSESPSSAVQALTNDYGERIWGNVRNLVRAAQETGDVVAGDPGELVYMLNAIIQGLTLNLTLDFYEPTSFPSVEMVMRYLLPNPSTQREDTSHAD